MAKPKKVFEKRDPYQDATDKIIAALEAGTTPWQRPWELQKGGMKPEKNVTGDPYRGINNLLLSIAMIENGWGDNRFATYKQGEALGTFVKKGEKGTTIYFSKPMHLQDKGEDGSPIIGPDNKPKIKTVYLLKAHTVFNASQFDKFPELDLTGRLANQWDPIEKAEEICNAVNVETRHGGNSAHYSPSSDYIQMPEREQFKSASDYYAVRLHEIAHSTGHHSRLNRDLTGSFGSPSYAFEELIAEMSSMYITSEIGLPEVSASANVDRHASYVKSWLKALQDDKKLIFKAAKAAESVHKFVMGNATDLSNDSEIEAEVESDQEQAVEPKAPSNVVVPESDDEVLTRSRQALESIGTTPRRGPSP